jgi:hypothetical protein
MSTDSTVNRVVSGGGGHRYNDGNWGLALIDIPQVILSSECSAGND